MEELITIILGFTQLFTIFIIIMFEYENNFTSVFIWATLLVIFGLPHLISSLIGHNEFSKGVINKASMFVILFNMLYLLMKYILNRTKKKKFTFGFDNNFFKLEFLFNKVDNLNKSNMRLANICFLLLIGMFLITYQLMGGFKEASWGKYFSFYGKGYGNIMLYFVYIFYAISGVALLYAKNGYGIKSMITTSALIGTAIITNTKMMFISVMLLLLAPIVFNDKNKFSTKKVIIGVMSIFGVVYFINSLYMLRTYGNISNLLDNLTLQELNTNIFNMISNSKGELGVRNAFYLFVEKNNNFHDFGQGHTYIRMLMMGIPSKFSFNLKPIDFAVTMGSAYIGDINNTVYSMHPTFYGDSFANFGWGGIFLGVFWALLTYLIDRFIHSKNTTIRDILMVSVCTCYVMIGRGSVYNSFMIIVTSIIIILCLDFLSRIRINSKTNF